MKFIAVGVETCAIVSSTCFPQSTNRRLLPVSRIRRVRSSWDLNGASVSVPKVFGSRSVSPIERNETFAKLYVKVAR